MLGNIGDIALQWVSQYGFFAVIVFMFLETSLLFPFLPSEVVVPGAAALLIDGPVTFVLFVTSIILGTTGGSLFLYYVFREYGRDALAKYGSYIRISDDDIDRGCNWFQKWGESSVLWGRLLPGLRSVVSIPAGLSEMGYMKFALYSAFGGMGFGAVVAGLVITGTSLWSF